MKSLLTKAKGGDTRIALAMPDRLLPPIKAAELPAVLPSMTGTRTEQSAAILQGVVSGEIAPGQAAQLLGALASQAKIAEVDELERRLARSRKRSPMARLDRRLTALDARLPGRTLVSMLAACFPDSPDWYAAPLDDDETREAIAETGNDA